MTGGQAVDGPLDPAMITRQVAAEGVQRIVVVSDDPQKYPSGTAWAAGVAVEHRDHLDRVQKELRDTLGVSVLLYDQTCARSEEHPSELQSLMRISYAVFCSKNKNN